MVETYLGSRFHLKVNKKLRGRPSCLEVSALTDSMEVYASRRFGFKLFDWSWQGAIRHHL